MDYLPKGGWDQEGEEYTALYLQFDHFFIENQLVSDLSHSVAAAVDDPEANISGEQCILVVPQAADLDEVPL